MRSMMWFMRRTVRATALVVGDRRIPRPLRGAAGLALLPVPGPFDEAVLLLLAVPLFAFYRRPLRDAWERAAMDAKPGRRSTPSRRSATAAGASAPMTMEVDDVCR